MVFCEKTVLTGLSHSYAHNLLFFCRGIPSLPKREKHAVLPKKLSISRHETSPIGSSLESRIRTPVWKNDLPDIRRFSCCFVNPFFENTCRYIATGEANSWGILAPGVLQMWNWGVTGDAFTLHWRFVGTLVGKKENNSLSVEKGSPRHPLGKNRQTGPPFPKKGKKIPTGKNRWGKRVNTLFDLKFFVRKGTAVTGVHAVEIWWGL